MFEIRYIELVVMAGTALLGALSGIIGSFAVLRGRALLGDALAHATLPGLALSFLLFQQKDLGFLLAGAMVTGVLGVWVVAVLRKHTRTKEDSAIGIVLSVFFGGGVVVMRIIQNTNTRSSKAGLGSYLYGSTASMTLNEVYLFLALVAVTLAVTLLLYKEFKLLSFDPEFCEASGFSAFWLDLLIMALLAVTTVMAVSKVGLLMAAALLIIPAAAARFWTHRLGLMLTLAAAFGAASGIGGTLVSASGMRLSAGAVIVLCAAAVFVLSMVAAPSRGLIAQLVEHLRLKGKTARQNLLRTLYELTEPHLAQRAPVRLEQLLAQRSWSAAAAGALLRGACRRGHVERDGEAWRLTEAGVAAAAEVVRIHRLWELYLIHEAQVATAHVDRDADRIEHVLPPAMIAALEAELRESGRLPEAAAVPVDPHGGKEAAGS